MLGRRHHTDTPPFFFFDFDAPEPILSGHAVLWLLLLACLALQQPRAYVRACVCRFQVVVLLLRTCSHARTIRPCTLRFAVLPPARPPTHARTHTQSETLTISPPPALPRSLGPPTQPRVRLSFEARDWRAEHAVSNGIRLIGARPLFETPRTPPYSNSEKGSRVLPP